MARNSMVTYLIDETIKKSGSDFTSAISGAGDGNMQQGLITVWQDGENTGLGKGITGTSIVFTVFIGGCILIQKAIHKHRFKKALAELADEYEHSATSIAPKNKDSSGIQSNINETREQVVEFGGYENA